jgi:FG-GAP repeat
MRNFIFILFIISNLCQAQSITLQPGTSTDPVMLKIENQATGSKPRSFELPVVTTEERQKFLNPKTGTTVFDKDSRQTFTFLNQSGSEKFWIGATEILQVPNSIPPSPATNNIGFGDASDMTIYNDPLNLNVSNFVVVAAPNDAGNKGAVFIYRLNGNVTTSYNQIAKLTASDGVAGDEFGTSVAIMEGCLVVGAPKHNSQKGAVYVFKVTPIGATSFTWAETSKLVRPSAAVGDLFGSNVCVYSPPYYGTEIRIIAASSPGDDLPSPAVTDIGSVSVFKENTSNVWTLIQTLKETAGSNGEGLTMKLKMKSNAMLVWSKNTSPSTAEVTSVTFNALVGAYGNFSTLNISEKIFDFDMPPAISYLSSLANIRLAIGLQNKAQIFEYNDITNTWAVKFTVTPAGFAGTNFGYGVRLNTENKLYVRDYQNQFVAKYADIFTTVLKLQKRIYFADFTTNSFPKGSMIAYYDFLFLGEGNSSATSPGRFYGLNTAIFSFEN